MPDLKAIIAKRCPVSFDWHGERIELAYRPYSEKIENEIRGEDEGWSLPNMKRLVERVVLDWNITVDGQPAPVDAATLTELPSELVMGIFYACQNDLRNPTLPVVTSATSDGTSPPTAA